MITLQVLFVLNYLFLESENPKKEISFYINSPGGIVWSGLAMYDTMQYISPEIMTICIGQAASAGSLLLTAGSKDMRFSLPNSRIMVHQPSGGYQGQVTDIEIHTNEIKKTKQRLNEIYSKHTGKKIEEIQQVMERDKYFSPEEAVEFGLIDKIVESRKAIMSKKEDKDSLFCSFCGKSQKEVKKLIAGPTVFVCDECVELCMDIIKEDSKNNKKN